MALIDVELCAGAGGQALGLKRAGFETALAFEFYPPAADKALEPREVTVTHSAQSHAAKAAFDSLWASDGALCRRWQAFVLRHWNDGDYLERARTDPRFMSLYNAAYYSETPAEKRDAMAAFLAEFDPQAVDRLWIRELLSFFGSLR